ncbi:hypothetical protein P152DRAFT_506851 [Eremomyces bilateralis CBS 781.70]|uniref:SET domain-containing protein n=1 Tax=Eremomyces bilateralis CBS 781.70 TaxID=1392243 RepID=A0A6G1G5R8_9PEZI|nr:uncharacterized protein P152DRAFT_506851 [Eremomyces bilateralis CBS 781.70]KAF1813179.1 hypothetical protein P152DRAFT_506851 [Eremomyces bilateralis CBS 781.70]
MLASTWSPCLSEGVVDRHKWNRFIGFIKNHYKDDSQVEIKPNYILFKAGEHPILPFEGHKFLHFSSKVSGIIAVATRVASYINTITRISKVHFGSRVQYWDEGADQYGNYDGNERDEPEINTSIASLLTGTNPIKELGIPLFEIKDIPGKGKGLIALLTAQSMPPNELELIFAARLRARRNNNFCPSIITAREKHPFNNTFKTNALPCGAGSVVGGVNPTICLINHNCILNSYNNWDSNAEHETIYAIRPIKTGEEVTISYNHGGTLIVRRAFLKEAFGFDYNCPSNSRRLLIQDLDDAIGDLFRMQIRPKESLSDCHSLLQVLQEEYDGYARALIARLYYDAF